ncbi:hypothetical protein BY996DRAFT_6504492 [Phakopsora pachyrhizi]|nr:hypothetical protein BY996DRAFT_6504492 [Phakopsora pachyrhizi]
MKEIESPFVAAQTDSAIKGLSVKTTKLDCSMTLNSYTKAAIASSKHVSSAREVGNGSVLAKSSNEKKMSNKDSGDQHNETDWPL